LSFCRKEKDLIQTLIHCTYWFRMTSTLISSLGEFQFYCSMPQRCQLVTANSWVNVSVLIDVIKLTSCWTWWHQTYHTYNGTMFIFSNKWRNLLDSNVNRTLGPIRHSLLVYTNLVLLSSMYFRTFQDVHNTAITRTTMYFTCRTTIIQFFWKCYLII